MFEPETELEEQENKIRNLLEAFPSANHKALDDRFLALLRNATSESPHSNLANTATLVLNGLQRTPNEPDSPRLIRGDDWRARWQHQKYLSLQVNTGDLDSNAVVSALSDALKWLANLVMESTSLVKQREHRTLLVTALRHYLELRGHVIPDDPGPGEADKTPPDAYTEVRQFARAQLKGIERALIEALCDADGELPLADLAFKTGVDWEDPVQNFAGAQRRLKPKLHPLGWELRRRNNGGILRRYSGDN